MIKTLKDLNNAGRRFWAGANAKTKDAVPPGMEKCPNCGGFGRKYGEPCDVCHGKGFVPEGSDFGKDASEPDEGAEAKRIRAEMAKVKADNALSEGQKNFRLAHLEKELRQANKDL